MTGRLARLVLAAALCASASPAATPEVRYADGRVTADVHDVDLAELLAAIASKAGFAIRGTPTTHAVTIALDAVPVADAVSRLVEHQRVAYTYDRDGGLKRVEFLDVGAEVALAPKNAARPAAPPDDQPPSAGVAPRDRPVPIDGLLAGALGADHSTFSQLVGVALQSGDARVRKEAMRLALSLLDGDADLRADVAATLDGLDDAGAASRLQEIVGARAEETAVQIARMTRWRPLRQRAVAVLRVIRTGG